METSQLLKICKFTPWLAMRKIILPSFPEIKIFSWAGLGTFDEISSDPQFQACPIHNGTIKLSNNEKGIAVFYPKNV